MICPVCHRENESNQVCADCLKNAPMRMTREGECRDCKYEWKAPKIGRCPRCRSENTFCEGAYTNGLKRL